ncbi:potassium channel family protein [Flavimarina sp. Hel_I_48]|uniref:potassium channel family protein n=1 Tax=Flavimarina sp. Hel_I_48 TaxID=1392488 RepID=UPI0004DF60F2|nr:potassium channel family protein [Flavimarina sp. Hel_I_48]
MSEPRDIEYKNAFYTQLISKALPTIAVIVGLSILSLWVLPRFRDAIWLSWSILVFALVKTYFIVRLSFDQLMKIIGQSHLLSHILVLFGLLISMIIISFAFDFTSLQFFDPQNFKFSYKMGITGIKIFFEHIYFSTITFSSVGYGDVVPISVLAKTLVMLEIGLRFFVLVFGIANINQIRINENK